MELDTPGESYTGANGVVFFIPDPSIGSIASGTNNFLALRDTNDADDIEAGFNTSAVGSTYPSSANGVQDVVSGGTDDLLTSDIPIHTGVGGVLAAGVKYYEIALSIQETGGSNFVTLLEQDVGGHTAAGLSNFDLQAGTITDIGALAADTLRLFDVYGGTNADTLIYIPTSLVTDVNFLFYAALDDATGGNENWAVSDTTPFAVTQALLVPEPSSLAMVGLLGGVLWRRRKRRSSSESAAD